MNKNISRPNRPEDSENVPVSSENFELWIRMATDNKINASNTWNFALIDYFHDFTVLREGDGVNFQKASTTLDGCMKIYSHRIDSAAKDTGTLLSSLNISSIQNADSSRPNTASTTDPNGIGRTNSKGSGEGNEFNDGHGDNNDENDEDFSDDANDDGVTDTGRKSKSKSKNKNKKKASYLASSFNTLRIKDQDRPVKPDPVFKNALASFDEGGAKSLLNNILRLSKDSKVVFDIADDTEVVVEDVSSDGDVDMGNTETEPMENKIQQEDSTSTNSNAVNINFLKSFVDFDIISQKLDVCPSLTELNDIAAGKADPANLLEHMDEVDVSRIEKDRRHNISDHQEHNFKNDEVPPEFDFDINGDMDINNGEQKEDDAYDDNDDRLSNASKRTQYSLYIDGVEDPDESGHNITFTNLFDENFDKETEKEADDPLDANKLDKTDIDMIQVYDRIGARPQLYWKIARLKRYMNNHRPFEDITREDGDKDPLSPKKKNKRLASRTYKRKEAILIDFMSDTNDAEEDELFASTDYLSKIMLTEKERKSGRHLLEGDAPFTAKRLAFLSTKPKQLIKSVLTQKRKDTFEQRELDNIPASEEFFAQVYQDEKENDILNDSVLSDPIEEPPSYNDNDDFDPNGVEGFDVPLINPLEEQYQNLEYANSQPQNLYRTNAISYAKRSKKVDVKLLKQNLWSSIEEISIHKKKRTASQLDEDAEEGEVEPTTAQKHSLAEVVENEPSPTEAEFSTTRSEESTSMTTTRSSPAMDDAVDDGEDIDTMHFANVVERMSSKYNTSTKKDLSTSFCFICLLHLANEKGLTLETSTNNEDIIIHR